MVIVFNDNSHLPNHHGYCNDRFNLILTKLNITIHLTFQ